MSLIIISTDLLMRTISESAKRQGERNIRLLSVLRKADKTIFGDDFKARNVVVIS
jgi:hypothetical protein